MLKWVQSVEFFVQNIVDVPWTLFDWQYKLLRGGRRIWMDISRWAPEWCGPGWGVKFATLGLSRCSLSTAWPLVETVCRLRLVDSCSVTQRSPTPNCGFTSSHYTYCLSPGKMFVLNLYRLSCWSFKFTNIYPNGLSWRLGMLLLQIWIRWDTSAEPQWKTDRHLADFLTVPGSASSDWWYACVCFCEISFEWGVVC